MKDHKTHIVALSGGKDSTAMAVRMKELNRHRYIFICTPTGDELPDMQTHWNKLETILDQPIIRLRDEKTPTIYDLIDDFAMLPNFRARWCSRILKIELSQRFYELVKPAVIYVGLRADEQDRKGNKLFDDNIEQRFPMKEWGWKINDVMSYLDKKQITIPHRTDCAMCFYQRIGEWWNLWYNYPDRFKMISDIEDRIGHTLISPGKFANWPHKLSELSKEFAKGRTPKDCDRQMKIFADDDGSRCRVCSL